MAAAALKQGTGTEVRVLLEKVVRSIEGTLGSLVGREIHVAPRDVLCQSARDVLSALSGPRVVARGEMDKEFRGKAMLTAFEVPDAVAMAGLLMMTPDDVIAERRKTARLEGEDIEAFGELGNVLYSGISDAVRERVDEFGVRMQAQGHLAPDADEDGLLGEEPLLTITFGLRVGEYPETEAMLAVDMETAGRWNGSPIELAGDASTPAPAPAAPDDEGLEDIPAAPVRGSLAAYVTQTDAFRLLRRSGRRVGLGVRRHGRGEVPNPSAHRGEVVVVDVPAGEEQRFGWCSRLKELSPATLVVVLLHHASRARVAQAFRTRADAIVAYPCAESELSQRLAPLVEQLSPPAGAPDRA
ncbi:MAG: hypothetical protein ACON4Z_10120 [Planctomycetota bacterium]